MANYSRLNSKKHKEITATLLNTDDNDEPLDVPVPLLPLAEYRIPQANSVPLPNRKLQTHSQTQAHTMHITRTETEMCQRSVSRESGSFLFGGPIYEGTFNVTINKNLHVKRRRTMVIDSDSESDD